MRRDFHIALITLHVFDCNRKLCKDLCKFGSLECLLCTPIVAVDRSRGWSRNPPFVRLRMPGLRLTDFGTLPPFAAARANGRSCQERTSRFWAEDVRICESLAVCGRPSVGKRFLERCSLLVGAATCPACDAALSCAAGHDAFRADRVPTNCSHSRCTGQNGFS